MSLAFRTTLNLAICEIFLSHLFPQPTTKGFWVARTSTAVADARCCLGEREEEMGEKSWWLTRDGKSWYAFGVRRKLRAKSPFTIQSFSDTISFHSLQRQKVFGWQRPWLDQQTCSVWVRETELGVTSWWLIKEEKSSCVFGVDRNKRTSSKIANHSFYL